MGRHVNGCQPLKRVKSSQRSLSGFFNLETKSESSQHQKPITKGRIEEQILKFVIATNGSFNQIENQYFRELVSWIPIDNRPARAPSRKIIRARLSANAKAAKEDLKNVLIANESKISLALDCWSTRRNFGFLGTSFILQYNAKKWFSKVMNHFCHYILWSLAEFSSYNCSLDWWGLEPSWSVIRFCTDYWSSSRSKTCCICPQSDGRLWYLWETVLHYMW